MATVTVYGEGGFCEECTTKHKHPLHNIIEEYEIEETNESISE